MLILTRRPGQKIFIGDDIKICVLQHKGYQYKLGVHAPKDVPVHREEIYMRIQEEKRKQEALSNEQLSEKEEEQGE